MYFLIISLNIHTTNNMYTLSLNESDLQCTNGRSGILCGRCQPGLSLMLGSNKCRSCNDRYLLLLVVFILAGIILVIFLLVFNLMVSVGSINGLLFYANMIKLNENVCRPIFVDVDFLVLRLSLLSNLATPTCMTFLSQFYKFLYFGTHGL